MSLPVAWASYPRVMDDGFDDLLQALAEAEPAAAGAPPRRPPTAVGAPGYDTPRHEDSRSLTVLIRQIAGELASPIRVANFNPETEAALNAAGIRTVGDLLRLSDRQMRGLGVDEATREYLVGLRRAMRVPTLGR